MKKCKCHACKQDRRILQLEQQVIDLQTALARKADKTYYTWTQLTPQTTPGILSIRPYTPAGHQTEIDVTLKDPTP